jgi:hypothetical protein
MGGEILMQPNGGAHSIFRFTIPARAIRVRCAEEAAGDSTVSDRIPVLDDDRAESGA